MSHLARCHARRDAIRRGGTGVIRWQSAPGEAARKISSWWFKLGGAKVDPRFLALGRADAPGPEFDICLWEAFYRSG